MKIRLLLFLATGLLMGCSSHDRLLEVNTGVIYAKQRISDYETRHPDSASHQPDLIAYVAAGEEIDRQNQYFRLGVDYQEYKQVSSLRPVILKSPGTDQSANKTLYNNCLTKLKNDCDAMELNQSGLADLTNDMDMINIDHVTPL